MQRMEDELEQHRELLNAIVETIHGMHADLMVMARNLDAIQKAQVEHGKALEGLKQRFDRRSYSSHPPRAISLSKIGDET